MSEASKAVAKQAKNKSNGGLIWAGNLFGN